MNPLDTPMWKLAVAAEAAAEAAAAQAKAAGLAVAGIVHSGREVVETRKLTKRAGSAPLSPRQNDLKAKTSPRRKHGAS